MPKEYITKLNISDLAAIRFSLENHHLSAVHDRLQKENKYLPPEIAKQWQTLLHDKYDQKQLLPLDFSADISYDDIDPDEQVPDHSLQPDKSTSDDPQQSTPCRLRSGRAYYLTTTSVCPILKPAHASEPQTPTSNAEKSAQYRANNLHQDLQSLPHSQAEDI